MQQSPYSEDFLSARKTDLERVQSELLADLKQIAVLDQETGMWTPKANDFDPDSPEDFVDDATEATDLIERSARVEDLAKELGNVQAALSRIESNAYGWDDVAGEYISAERLEAYPAARRVVDDAE